MNWYKQSNKQYYFIGNCIKGLEDDQFQERVSYDSTEMAQLVENSIKVNNEQFIQNCNVEIGLNLGSCEFSYNQDRDIFIAYDTNSDTHYFFVKRL